MNITNIIPDDTSPLDKFIAKREALCQPPPPPRPSLWPKVVSMTLTVFGVILTLLVIAIAKVASKDATKWLLSDASPTPYSSLSWTRYALESVSFDSPTPIVGPGENMRSQLAEPVKSLITSVYEYNGTAYHGSLLIGCIRMTCASGVPYNLDAGIQGAISQVAQTLNDKNPKYTLTTTSIDGLEARRAVYRPTAGGYVVENLIVVDHKGIAWMFMAIGESKYAKDAQRMIDSVHIANN
jgi:hypothetical protein